MEEFQIVTAQPEHVQPLSDMIRIAAEADVARGNSPAWLSHLSAERSVRAAVAAEYMRAVKLNNEIVGCFSIDFADPLFWGASVEVAWYLHLVTVVPAYQGQGIGRRVIAWVEDSAVEAGMNFVRLDIPIEREMTRNWYRGMGYVERGVMKVPSRGRAAMLYEKILKMD